MKITILSIVLALFCLWSFGQDISTKDDKYYFEKVKAAMEKAGGFHPIIKDDISKAIEINPTNSEYRWIRARANFNSHSDEEDFTQAIADLEKMIELGDSTAKVYAYQGLANKELGDIYNYQKKATKNESFSDDDSAYLTQQKNIYTSAIKYYQKSIEGYKKAIDVNPDKFKESFTYEVNDLLKKITDIEAKKEKLK